MIDLFVYALFATPVIALAWTLIDDALHAMSDRRQQLAHFETMAAVRQRRWDRARALEEEAEIKRRREWLGDDE